MKNDSTRVRRAWAAVLGAAVALVLAIGVVLVVRAHHDSAGGPAAGPDTRPNVILITTDDQTLSDLRWMTKTKKMFGEHATTFSTMLSPHPLCCPARAEILTGEYAQTNGVHSNEGPYGGYPNLIDPGNTIGSWLHDSGYHTALIGKFLNKWNPRVGIPPGWDYWQSSIKSAFGYYGYKTDLNGTIVDHPKDGIYSTDLVSRATDSLIDHWSGSGSPFFIWSSYYAPHGLCGEQHACKNPPAPAHKYADYPVPETAPSITKASFDEKDRSDKPELIRKQKPVTKKFAQRMFTQRIRSLQSVDDAVQSTVDRLAADGSLANTYLLFTSDNGFLIGEHSYLGKILPYEEALRVPLLVAGPQVAAHRTITQTVTTVDLAATIADMAGVTPAREQDGDSLLPMLQRRGPAPARDSVLIQAGGLGHGDHANPWLYRGVRTQRYMFARWVETNDIFPELYDLSDDPLELTNVADDPRYRAVRRAMMARLRILDTCTGAVCNQRFGPLPAVGSTTSHPPDRR